MTVEQIKEALADSTVLKVDEEFNLSRQTPYTEKNFTDSTVYVKGLPTGFLLDQILAFFEHLEVRPELVVFKKNLKGSNKGSFDMIYPTVEQAQKCLQLFGNQTQEDGRCLKSFEKFNNVNNDRRDKQFLVPYKDFLLQNLTVIPAASHQAKPEEETKLEKQVKTYVKGLIIKLSNMGVIGVKNGEIDKNFVAQTENLAD